MDINHNLVSGCPLCNIFLDTENSIMTKLHYKNEETLENSDFIVISHKVLSTPMITVRDHVPSISNDLWGKILYECRKMYGSEIRLKANLKFMPEHFHAYIIR